MKNCLCTAIGVAVGIAAVAGGIVADMLIMNRICCPTRGTDLLRRKASNAMHTIGDKINKAADNIAE